MYEWCYELSYFFTVVDHFVKGSIFICLHVWVTSISVYIVVYSDNILLIDHGSE